MSNSCRRNHLMYGVIGALGLWVCTALAAPVASVLPRPDGKPADMTVPVEDLEDISQAKPIETGKEYRFEFTGICGIMEESGMPVTRVLEGSPADGIIRAGDIIEAVHTLILRLAQQDGTLEARIAKEVFRTRAYYARSLLLRFKRVEAVGMPPRTISASIQLEPVPGEIHQFGPIGIFAQMYPDHLIVDSIVEGSPAEGKLRKGDRIVALNGSPLRGSLQKLFAKAIDLAESKDGAGRLVLSVQRAASLDANASTNAPARTRHDGSPELLSEDGSYSPPQNVELQLDVLGSYSPTAPYNCPKTNALIRLAADAIVERKEYGRVGVGLLALLATGETKYIDHVGEYLRAGNFGKPDPPLYMDRGKASWYASYESVIAAEYYLLTRDEAVLPALRKYAIEIAKSQDAAGLWGHQGVNPERGRIPWYGAMNQTSVIHWIGLILAQKCGIDHPEVREAISRTHTRYGNWIGKGSLPYGNHRAWEHILNNNGTSGSAAIGFSLLGDKEGARFYSMLATVSHDELMAGHQGPFFSFLWSAPGANVAGPDAAGVYAQRTRWARTLTRTADGRYLDPRATGIGGRDLGCSGSALINHCLGRRAIYVTGKDSDRSLWMTRSQAEALAGMASEELRALSTEDCLKRLGSPLPKVRVRAARSLALRNAQVSAELRKALASDNLDLRIGACTAIEELKTAEFVDPLLAILNNPEENIWLREKAVQALQAIGEPARKCVPDMLRIVVEHEPDDPLGDLDRTLGRALVALCPDPYELDLDKDTFYKAIHTLLDHEHMWARNAGMSLLRNMPREELPRIIDKLLHVIEDKDPSYTTYHNNKRTIAAGLEILKGFGIEDPAGKSGKDVLNAIE